jgi:hypothetical protein
MPQDADASVIASDAGPGAEPLAPGSCALSIMRSIAWWRLTLEPLGVLGDLALAQRHEAAPKGLRKPHAAHD